MSRIKNTLVYEMGQEIVVETPGVKAIGVKGAKRSDVRIIYDKTPGHNIAELEEIHAIFMERIEKIRRTLGEIFFPGIKPVNKKKVRKKL